MPVDTASAAAGSSSRTVDSPHTGEQPYATDPSREGTVTSWVDALLPRLLGYFVSRVGGRMEVAEDLVQETLIAAVTSDSRPEPMEALAPWVFGIARHKLMDHYRQQARESDRLEPFDEFTEAVRLGERQLPEIDVDSIHARECIVSILDQLPARQRGAIVFRYLDGLSVPETAEMLETTVHAAESLLARAKSRFRALYHAASGDEQ